MATKKTTGKKLADMMYGNPEGAAFGITPFIGKRREDRQDREAAKNFPVDLGRGAIAGALGVFGDMESVARLPYELITGNESPTFLPTSEDVLKRIPFGSDSPAGRFASGIGTIAGGSAPLGPAYRGVKALPGALKTVARNVSTPRTLDPQAGAIVYHGSPHKFDKFSSKKIGTGEGAQAYGHGLYFAESPEVAKTYQPRSPEYEQKLIDLYQRASSSRNYPMMEVLEDAMLHRTPNEIVEKFTNADDGYSGQHAKAAQDFVKWYSKNEPEVGGLYTVDLPDEKIAQMLDYDKPLSAQSPEVKRVLMEHPDVLDYIAKAEAQRVNLNEMSPVRLEKIPSASAPYDESRMAGKDVITAIAQRSGLGKAQGAIEEELRQLGIPGIRYLDEQSRGSKGADGSSNYVVFPGEEEALTIVDRKADGGPVHFSDNPDVMQLELAKGGAVRMQAGGLAKAAKALKAAKEQAQAPMKASEALGRIEGRPLVITQADRTKVGGGFLGGPGFSGLQLEDPAYRAAEAAWAVKNSGTAKTILGGKRGSDDAVFAAMLGTPTQHQSNQMVFDKLLNSFLKAAKKGELDPAQRDKINMLLANSVNNDGNPIFPPDVDILGKNFKDLASTFDRRAVTASLIGGTGVGGKKGQIIDYDKIIRQTTDPMLLDKPTGALGNRLFTLSGGIIERPDLHPAFPTILQGEDLGVRFDPVARELIMKDFTQRIMEEKGRKPGYMDYTKGYPPSQLITEDILTELQKMGKKKGGEVKAPAAQIDGNQFVVAAQKYKLGDDMSTLNKMVSLVNMGATVDEAARALSSGVRKAGGGEVHGLSTADLLYLQSQEDLGKLPAHAQREAITNMGGQEVRQRMAGKMAGGGEITADDLILEERKL
jgi:hypothetical protein